MYCVMSVWLPMCACRAMDDMMTEDVDCLREIVALYSDVNAGSGMIWQIENSANDLNLGSNSNNDETEGGSDGADE